MRYSVEIRDQFGRLVTVLQRPRNKSISLFRNRPGSCQFTLDLLDPQATLDNLKINQYDVVMRREGTPVVAGQISYLNPRVDGDDKSVEVIATGYFDLLDYRYITADYPDFDLVHAELPFASTDTSQIAWALIDSSQFPLSSDGSVLMQGTTPTLNQSFVCPGASSVKKIRLLFQKSGTPTGNLVVGIYTDVGGSPGNLVANSQQSIALSGISTSLAWVDITYTTKPSLVNGTRYWIKAHLSASQTGSNGLRWHYLNNDFYLSGKAYSPEDADLFTLTQDLQFFILLDDNSYQMTKNTYLGLTQGDLAASFELTPVFAQYKKVKQCIEELSNTYTGIDFAISVVIDPVTNHMTKVFNTYYPRQGIDNTDLSFFYPGNIKRFGKPRDAKTLENEVAVRGQGIGKAQPVEVAYDQASIQTYGQKQDVENEADINDSGTLQSLGEEFIRVRKDPLDIPTITLDGNQPPYLGTFWLGDTIQISVFGIPLIETLDTFRIEEINVKISDDDQEDCEISLSRA